MHLGISSGSRQDIDECGFEVWNSVYFPIFDYVCFKLDCIFVSHYLLISKTTGQNVVRFENMQQDSSLRICSELTVKGSFISETFDKFDHLNHHWPKILTNLNST